MCLPYSRIAEKYDELFGAEQAKKHLVVASLVDTICKTVLDIGCGTGMFSELLGKCTYYICLDISREMLEVFMHKRRNRVFSDPLLANMELLPLRKCSVDNAIFITSIHEADNIAEALDAAVRSLKKGGLLVISLNTHFQEIERQITDRISRKGDLAILKIIETSTDKIFLAKKKMTLHGFHAVNKN